MYLYTNSQQLFPGWLQSLHVGFMSGRSERRPKVCPRTQILTKPCDQDKKCIATLQPRIYVSLYIYMQNNTVEGAEGVDLAQFLFLYGFVYKFNVAHSFSCSGGLAQHN
jgi:hypothetical protein